MDTGLEKLKEASLSVGVLKKDLAVMEQELVEASERAQRVLTEVTERASQAEIVKNQVMIVKEKAEILVTSIAEEKALAEVKLEAAKPALEEAEAALNTIKPAHIGIMQFFHTIEIILSYIFLCSYCPKIGPTTPFNHENYGLRFNPLPKKVASINCRWHNTVSQTIMARIIKSKLYLP